MKKFFLTFYFTLFFNHNVSLSSTNDNTHNVISEKLENLIKKTDEIIHAEKQEAETTNNNDKIIFYESANIHWNEVKNSIKGIKTVDIDEIAFASIMSMTDSYSYNTARGKSTYFGIKEMAYNANIDAIRLIYLTQFYVYAQLNRKQREIECSCNTFLNKIPKIIDDTMKDLLPQIENSFSKMTLEGENELISILQKTIDKKIGNEFTMSTLVDEKIKKVEDILSQLGIRDELTFSKFMDKKIDNLENILYLFGKKSFSFIFYFALSLASFFSLYKSLKILINTKKNDSKTHSNKKGFKKHIKNMFVHGLPIVSLIGLIIFSKKSYNIIDSFLAKEII